MEHTGNRSAKCQQKTLLYLAIGCCIPLLISAMPSNLQLLCKNLQFEYKNPGNSSVSLHRCLDVCPPTKNAMNNRIFCCRNCPEYCARCLDCSSTKPSEIHESYSSKTSPEEHPTKSSSTSAESSTLDPRDIMVPMQLETYRHQKAEWQRKEIVYIAIISCLVFALITMTVAFLVHYKCTPPTTTDRERSNSTSRSEVSETPHDRQGLLNNQQLVQDQKRPVEHAVGQHQQHPNSSLCALGQNDSLEATENRTTNYVLNANNTPLKDFETSSSQCRDSLMSDPHTLHEDSSRCTFTVTGCESCSELQALP
jgi:hypothetical protein